MHATIAKFRHLADEAEQLHALYQELRGEALGLDDQTYFAGGLTAAIDRAQDRLIEAMAGMRLAADRAERELRNQIEAVPCQVVIV